MALFITNKFYTHIQNNSGGRFVIDDKYGVCETVIVEAGSARSAWKRLKVIGKNVVGFWDFCDCCGERWSNWMDDTDGTTQPTYFGDPLDKPGIGTYCREGCFVHYLDDTFKEVKFKKPTKT